jgi:hypothetical protein
LEQGVDALQHITPGEREFLSPLNFLCYRGEYRDAIYLFDRIQCKAAECTVALQFCFLRLWRTPAPLYTHVYGSPFYTHAYGSVQRLFDQRTEAIVFERPTLLEPDGEEALLRLVERLLAAGADPNFSMWYDDSQGRVPNIIEGAWYRSALRLVC